MAQLVEQRIRNAWVGGSSPPSGSRKKSTDNQQVRHIQPVVFLFLSAIFKAIFPKNSLVFPHYKTQNGNKMVIILPPKATYY